MWIVVAGAFICQIWEYTNFKLTFSTFRAIAKGETEENKEFFSRKSCRHFFLAQYFFVASVWGYLVLAPTDWLPWQLGGSKTI